jgi:hypothetical protein
LKKSKQKESKNKKSITEDKEDVVIKQETKRIYTCSCGRIVVLEGEIYKRKIKDGFELCSKCSN